ncbi:hypothetical protein HDU93_001159, partial [Gonapodya sp. JEL0774]
ATTTSSVLATYIPIGAVQGVVTDSVDGATFESPLKGQRVTVRGIVFEKVLSKTSAGATNYGTFEVFLRQAEDSPKHHASGFFIQDGGDGNDQTSDGVFCYTGTTNLAVSVGDDVILTATVSEYFYLTELTTITINQIVSTNNTLPTPVTVSPPDDFVSSRRYWERLEGMRVQMPTGSMITEGRNIFSSTADSEVWLIRENHPLALLSDPYKRHVFRDAHPLDFNYPNADGNGMRILLGGLGVKSFTNDVNALLADVTALDTLSAPAIGGVYFSFSKFQILPETQITVAPGPDPSSNDGPTSPNRPSEWSVATFNVENLYDFRDDPFDGCDFTGNSGCSGVSPPFDYVPASASEYQTHLGKIAYQIVFDLKAPEIILIEEAEDQDICIVSAGALSCGTTNNADGKPDTIQELALAVAAIGGPIYDTAFDRNSADARGIVPAFMYRTDRVALVPVSTCHPVFGNSPTVQYSGTALSYNTDVSNPKSLNAVLPGGVDESTGVDGSNVFTRAASVALFRIDGVEDVYVVANHFSSGPTGRIGQRKEQANYNGAIVQAIRAADPNAKIAVGGDLNVYPFPDDPLVARLSDVSESQLYGIYSAGMSNLFDKVLAESPANAYSYIFEGQCQVLDQIFVSPALLSDYVKARHAHVNSDFATESTVANRGATDHDPLVATFSLVPFQAANCGTPATTSSPLGTTVGTFTTTVEVTTGTSATTSSSTTPTGTPVTSLPVLLISEFLANPAGSDS